MFPDDPDEQRILTETIRQGMEGEFWRWLKTRLAAELTEDFAELASPTCPADKVAYLRGCIRARNDLLTLPESVLNMYASPDEPPEEEPDIPAARPMSPLQED